VVSLFRYVSHQWISVLIIPKENITTWEEWKYQIRTLSGLGVTIRRGLDWLFGFIDQAYSAIADMHFTVHRYTHYGSQSSVVVSWQQISTVIIPVSHVKSYLHRLTFKFQLNSVSSLLSHLPLPSQETQSVVIPAGLGSSLYSLKSDPTENTVSIFIAQLYLDCCLLISCRGNLFTES
jgi:hypothetical protein